MRVRPLATPMCPFPETTPLKERKFQFAPTRHPGCSLLFFRKFRFRLHICKVSILVLPLATVRTLPHPPPCNSCPARSRRHRMNSSVYPRFEILLLPLPREHVCCFRTQIHHYGCSLVSSVCFFVPQANR